MEYTDERDGTDSGSTGADNRLNFRGEEESSGGRDIGREREREKKLIKNTGRIAELGESIIY